MKKSVLLVPGAWGNITFKDDLIQRSDQNKLRFIAPTFPTIHDRQPFSSYAKILESLVKTGDLNEESTVIAHSAGTIGFIKFLAESGLKIDNYISVAGFTGTLIPSLSNKMLEAALKMYGYSLKDRHLEAASKLITNRHSFISNYDHLIPDWELVDYAKKLKSEVHFVKDHGHFSRTNNITHVPGLAELVNL